MGFQQIQAPTLRELFVDQVIGMIFSGELKVGDRLPSERELSEQMHISRSMVHTGLEDLERMGFVRMEPRRGNYIEDYARREPYHRALPRGRCPRGQRRGCVFCQISFSVFTVQRYDRQAGPMAGLFVVTVTGC